MKQKKKKPNPKRTFKNFGFDKSNVSFVVYQPTQ